MDDLACVARCQAVRKCTGHETMGHDAPVMRVSSWMCEIIERVLRHASCDDNAMKLCIHTNPGLERLRPAAYCSYHMRRPTAE